MVAPPSQEIPVVGAADEGVIQHEGREQARGDDGTLEKGENPIDVSNKGEGSESEKDFEREELDDSDALESAKISNRESVSPNNTASNHILPVNDDVASGTFDVEDICLDIKDDSIPDDFEDVSLSKLFPDSKGNPLMQEGRSSHHEEDDLSITSSLEHCITHTQHLACTTFSARVLF